MHTQCTLLTTWHCRLTDSFSPLTHHSHNCSREAIGLNTHLCFSHTICQKMRRFPARRWKDSLSFLFSFLPLRRSRLSMTSSGATFTCVFSGRCRCRTASLTLLHHAVSFSIWRGHELCLTSAFFFYLQDGSIYNELWIISGHWQWSRLRLSNSFL